MLEITIEINTAIARPSIKRESLGSAKVKYTIWPPVNPIKPKKTCGLIKPSIKKLQTNNAIKLTGIL